VFAFDIDVKYGVRALTEIYYRGSEGITVRIREVKDVIHR
jgi:hypothetical protein